MPAALSAGGAPNAIPGVLNAGRAPTHAGCAERRRRASGVLRAGCAYRNPSRALSVGRSP